MKIDLLHALTNRGGEAQWGDLLRGARHHAELADELGFDRIWLGEHHFDVAGTDACPNPILLAADLAARTSNIRLGMAAVSLTLWHPIRVAEDLAMLDHFSGGRLDVAFGRGILPIEVMNLNPEADRWGGIDTSVELFDEKFDIVTKLWTESQFRHDGKRYTLPTPGTKYINPSGAATPEGWVDENGDLVALTLYPQCVQDPHPPLFAVTESERGFRDAARKGIGAITWYPSGDVLRNLLQAYRAEYELHHGAQLPLGANVSALRICYVGETDQAAREVVEGPVYDFFRFINEVRGIGVWLDVHDDPQDRRWQNWRDMSRSEVFEFLFERGHLAVGSPEAVFGVLGGMTQSLGIQNWLLQMCIPGISSDEAIDSSMRLFAAEVLPDLRALGQVSSGVSL